MNLINRLFRRKQIPIAEALEKGKVRFRKKDLIFYCDKQTGKVLRTQLPKDERRWQEFGRHIEGYSVANQEDHEVEYIDFDDRMLVQATGEVKFSHSDGLERDIPIYDYCTPFKVISHRGEQHDEYGGFLEGKQKEFDYDSRIYILSPAKKGSKCYLFRNGSYQGARELEGGVFPLGNYYSFSYNPIPQETLDEFGYVIRAAADIAKKPNLLKILEANQK